jgi:hypothetical protein
MAVQVQAAANSATVNELDVDSWRALVAKRTLDLGAARAGVAECDAAATTVREAAIAARTVRATHGARAHRARCAHCLRITMPSRSPQRVETPICLHTRFRRPGPGHRHRVQFAFGNAEHAL